MQILDFLDSLHRCNTPLDVLMCLRLFAAKAGLAGIRYYRLRQTNDDDTLFSVESTDCSARVTERYRGGRVIKSRRTNPTDRSETFWAIDARYPIAFEIRHAAAISYPLQLAEPTDGLPFMYVASDPDDGQLTVDKQAGSRKWVDLPLFAGRWTIGKLSCDFADRDVRLESAETRKAVYEFFRIASTAAPALETLRNQNFSGPLRNIADIVRRLRTIDDVISFCTTGFGSDDRARAKECLRSATYFSCDNADFLSSSTDSNGNTSLVLRRTSFAPMRAKEHVAHYALNGSPPLALTAFTAMRERSVRIDGMLDFDRRREQLDSYETGLRWTQGIPLSSIHGSLMIVFVPIATGDGEREFAVIRLADKRDHLGSVIPFDERDQTLLEIIAQQTLGPRLLALNHQAVSSVMTAKLTNVRSVINTDVSPWKCLIDIASKVIVEDPAGIGTKKGYIISRYLPPGSFEIIEAGGQLVGPGLCFPQRFECAGTLTGAAIEKKDLVYVWDLEDAADQGIYRPIFDGGVSAMACPMLYRGNVTGAIGIVSNRRDLSVSRDGHILKALADDAAALLEHHRVALNTTLLAGLSHDFQTVLRALESALDGRNPPKEHAVQLVQMLGDLAQVHCCSKAPDPDILKAAARERNVRELVSGADLVAKSVNGQFGSVETRIACESECLVTVVPAYVSACLFNVLLNAIEQCKRSGGWVDVDVRCRDGALFIAIGNRCEREFKDLLPKGPWIEVSGELEAQRGRGLAIVRRLLSWYRFPGTDEGSIVYEPREQDAGWRCMSTLRFPVPRLDD